MARKIGHEVIPSAKRLMRSLRDMGYDFHTAVADLIDNSIEAGSSQVVIDVEFDGDDSFVRISDNGLGMNDMQLQEAMRYGSDRPYDGEKDLGKFGLGLKTASMSQCQKLIVASRSSKTIRKIHAYCWDLDHVDTTNKWEIVKPDNKTIRTLLNHHLSKTTGTVVLWQKLDRISGYKHPYGEAAKKRLFSMCRELEEHLAMVFHRFLTGEVPGKKLQIILNGNPIEPWDPFARSEPKTQELNVVPISLEYEGITGIVTLQPYILPNQESFSSIEAFKKAGGPKKWNNQQGFYIYRANRLIQSGGWSGIKTIDEHLKLARVALSFSPHLDEAFKINVPKMRVQLPTQIKDQIEDAIKPLTRIAQDTYRKSAQKQINNQVTPNPPKTSSSTAASKPPPLIQKVIPKNNTSSSSTDFDQPVSSIEEKRWTISELRIHLVNLASDDEKPIIEKIFDKLSSIENSGEN